MKKSIGNRITISQQEKETIIRIDGTIEGWMNHALLGWLVMWTIVGGYVAYFAFWGGAEEDQKFFFITYLLFWFYFEVKAFYSWIFRVSGFELIKITPDAWYIKRSVLSFGKVTRYVKENVKELNRVENDRKSVTSAFNKSFWVMGNERISFDYIGKKVGVGMHLVDKDRDALLMFLRKVSKRK